MRAILVSCMFTAAALVSTAASATKPCEELRAEIGAKLAARNITGYSLAIVAADQAGEAKVVGHCEGGTKVITYSKAPNM